MDRYSLFPEQASTFAPKVDSLFFFLVAMTAFFSILIFVLVLSFALKYRRRSSAPPPKIKPDMRLEVTWTVIPLLICMVIFFWSAKLFIQVYAKPLNPLNIHVVGKQWMWKIQHPEGNREINCLHVPIGRTVQLTISSQDVIHSFIIPAFRIKQDAVPGRYSRKSFTPTKEVTYHLFCAEYCGTEHSLMIGTVVVMEPEEYEAWLAGTAPNESMAQSGEALFKQLGCITCHGVQGPSMAGLYLSEVHFNRDTPQGSAGTTIADEDYLRESILYSTAKIVQGYSPIMPSFRGQVTEEQISQLIAYIKSLKAPQEFSK
jgi:cytochrome c oxidase subunit 2